jgi:hypothetical protein
MELPTTLTMERTLQPWAFASRRAARESAVSPLWLTRGEQSEVHYTPENGWDENHVKTFRRHIVNLGKTGLIFIYDELVADEPVNWSYFPAAPV